MCKKTSILRRKKTRWRKNGHQNLPGCLHHTCKNSDINSQAPQDKRVKEWTSEPSSVLTSPTRIQTSILRHHKRAQERTSEPSRLSKSYTQEFRHQFSGTTRRQGGKRGRRRGSTLTDVVDGEDATVEVALASSLGVPGDGQDGAARAVGCHQVCWPDRADHTQLEFRWNCGQALASSHTAQNTEISPVQPAICRVQVKRHITLWTGNIINELAQSHKQILNHCSLLYTELKWNATLWMSNINDTPPPRKKSTEYCWCVCACVYVCMHAWVCMRMRGHHTTVKQGWCDRWGWTDLPDVVMTMMAAAMQVKEASTAAMAMVWVGSVYTGVSLRSSSNCWLWKMADSASRHICRWQEKQWVSGELEMGVKGGECGRERRTDMQE